MIKIYTGGSFSAPHIGHAIFFEQIKRFWPESFLTVSLNIDEFICRFKNKLPIFSYSERVNYLIQLKSIDKIIPNIGNEDSKISILQEKPDIIAIGNDWLEKDYCKQMSFNADWLSEQKIGLIYVPRIGGLSVTLIEERIRNDK